MDSPAGGRQLFVDAWDVVIPRIKSTFALRVLTRKRETSIGKSDGVTCLLHGRVMQRVERIGYINFQLTLPYTIPPLYIISLCNLTSGHLVGANISIGQHGCVRNNKYKQTTPQYNQKVLIIIVTTTNKTHGSSLC